MCTQYDWCSSEIPYLTTVCIEGSHIFVIMVFIIHFLFNSSFIIILVRIGLCFILTLGTINKLIHVRVISKMGALSFCKTTCQFLVMEIHIVTVVRIFIYAHCNPIPVVKYYNRG